jgi:aryl-alcohol dehydrogenase-like predicted oxidoreductase
MWGGTEEKEAVAAIHAALDNGINAIDTAPVYGFGFSEELVGKAVEGRRDNVVIATKCGLVWHEQKGDFFFVSDETGVSHGNKFSVHRYLGPESIRYEVEQSLKRLRTDYIDLYQTHWQETTTPIEDTMTALMALKEEGKIRAIGVSNANTNQLAEYRRAGMLDTDQEKYSMLDRKMDSGQLAFCAKNSIAFLAYSPLALGLLTGKIGPDTHFGEGDLRLSNPRFSTKNLQLVKDMIDEFQPVADGLGITVAQLVIAWTVHQPGCTHALVGARKVRHAEENAQAGAVQLSEENLAAINGIIARYAGKLA